MANKYRCQYCEKDKKSDELGIFSGEGNIEYILCFDCCDRMGVMKEARKKCKVDEHMKSLDKGMYARLQYYNISGAPMGKMVGVNQDNAHGIEDEHNSGFDINKLMTPIEMYGELDKFVKGQDDAKKVMATAIYNHYIRVADSMGNTDISGEGEIFKNNIMVTGPTGSGKTLIAKTIAKMIGVPFARISATSLSETGYVGGDVENILTSLLKVCNMDVEKAQYGIVFVDEIDKKSKRGESTSITRDVSGEGVQQAMLTMMEGAVVGVPPNGGRVHPQQQLIEMDTSNILFICGGAFEGIEDIVRKRLNMSSKNSNKIGFSVNDLEESVEKKDVDRFLRQKVQSSDLVDYGMISEFMGRLPVICNLEPLRESELVEILKSKHGAMEGYKKQFKIMGKTLIFEEDAIMAIAKASVEAGTGARDLQSKLSDVMTDIMFKAPSEEKTEYRITKSYVEQKLFNEDLRFVAIREMVRKNIDGFFNVDDSDMSVEDIIWNISKKLHDTKLSDLRMAEFVRGFLMDLELREKIGVSVISRLSEELLVTMIDEKLKKVV